MSGPGKRPFPDRDELGKDARQRGGGAREPDHGRADLRGGSNGPASPPPAEAAPAAPAASAAPTGVGAVQLPFRSRWLDADSDDEDAPAPAATASSAPAAPPPSDTTGGAAEPASGGGPVEGGEAAGAPGGGGGVEAAGARAASAPPSRPASERVRLEDEDESGDAMTRRPTPGPSAEAAGPCRTVDCYEKLHKIDEGTYGVVYKARERKTGEIVALKQVKLINVKEGFPVTALREINVLLSLSHPNIINVREMVVGNSMDKIFMVMDFMEHDLKGLMNAMKQPFSASEVKRLMIDLTSAIAYCHEHWVLHRDLKTSNLLMNNRGQVCVCDFGLARKYGDPLKPYTNMVVTLWYRGPELLLGGKTYGPALDMWSLGCIFAELVLREPLLPGRGELDQIERIFKLLGTPNETIWPGCSELPHFRKFNFKNQPFNHLHEKFKTGPSFTSTASSSISEQGLDLMKGMLCLCPERRVTAKEALDHPYFKEHPPPKPHDLFPTMPSSHAGGKPKPKVKSVNEEEEARRLSFHQR